MKQTIIFAAAVAFAFAACNSQSSHNDEEHHADTEVHQHQGKHDYDGHKHTTSDHSQTTQTEGESLTVIKSDAATVVLNAYLSIKEALTKDDKDAAAKAGKQLAKGTASVNVSGLTDEEQNEVDEILEVVKEHGEHIAKSDIGHQREHFAMLGKDVTDLVSILGSDRTLYQQYCPMYNNNKGGSWISASEEVKNPLFGSKMLKCGKVQQTITTE